MEEKLSCETCKYFVQHFVKHGSTMTAVNCGNCRNPRLTLTQKRKRHNAGVCEHWEFQDQAQKEQTLEKVLLDLSEQLASIAAILKKDQP